MSDLDKLRADVEFLTEVLPLEEELEAARADKANDPVRFAEAKQVFEEKRRFYREIAQYVKATSDAVVDPSNVEIGLEPVHAEAEAISPVGDQ